MDKEQLCVNARLFVSYVSYHVRNMLLDAFWKCDFEAFFFFTGRSAPCIFYLYLSLLSHTHDYFQYKKHSLRCRNNAFNLGRCNSNERKNKLKLVHGDLG